MGVEFVSGPLRVVSTLDDVPRKSEAAMKAGGDIFNEAQLQVRFSNALELYLEISGAMRWQRSSG